MGGATSSCYSHGDVPTLEQTLPNYHVKNVEVSDNDIKIAKESWDLIMNNESPEFQRLKSLESLDENSTHSGASLRIKKEVVPSSCLTWFYDSFYSHLFKIHPSCKSMFRGSLKAQGKVLCKIIGISIGLRDDRENVGKILIAISKVPTS